MSIESPIICIWIIYIYTCRTSLLGRHLPWSIIAVWCVWFIKFTIFAQSLCEKSPFTRIWNPDGIPLTAPWFSHRNGMERPWIPRSSAPCTCAKLRPGPVRFSGLPGIPTGKLQFFYRENDEKIMIIHWNWEVYIYVCGIWYWCTGIWLWYNAMRDMICTYIYTGIIGNNQNTTLDAPSTCQNDVLPPRR